MALADHLYRSLTAAAWRLAPAAGRGGSKFARGVRARRDAADRLVEWARTARDPGRPLLWVHAPSVGEGLQARAVLDSLAALRPELQVVFTHFSPSAEALAAGMPAAYAGPLPWDSAGEAGRAVATLRPAAIVFTKTELWPVLAAEARAQGARTALVAATLHEGSSRLRWPARALLRTSLRSLDLVAAVGAADAERLGQAGAPARALRVTGDPGVDSAAARARAADPDAPHLRPFRAPRRPTLVAGSTWPSDEDVLLPSFAAARARHPGLRLVIAPHEPHPAAVRALDERLVRYGWRTARLAEVEARGAAGDADAVLVDRVGVLAQLYTIGDLAWVGGGFHRAGLHSVLEPAAAGIPILFGPRHERAAAAAELLALSAARVARTAADAGASLTGWLGDALARASAGRAAEGYISGHLGACARTAELVAGLIPITASAR